jgi:hypothetical protein
MLTDCAVARCGYAREHEKQHHSDKGAAHTMVAGRPYPKKGVIKAPAAAIPAAPNAYRTG